MVRQGAWAGPPRRQPQRPGCVLNIAEMATQKLPCKHMPTGGIGLHRAEEGSLGVGKSVGLPDAQRWKQGTLSF